MIGTVKGRIAVESCAAAAATDVWTATTDVMAAAKNITDPKPKIVFMGHSGCTRGSVILLRKSGHYTACLFFNAAPSSEIHASLNVKSFDTTPFFPPNFTPISPSAVRQSTRSNLQF